MWEEAKRPRGRMIWIKVTYETLQKRTFPLAPGALGGLHANSRGGGKSQMLTGSFMPVAASQVTEKC